MKTLIALFVTSLFLFTACTSSYKTASTYDEVYYTTKKVPANQDNEVKTQTYYTSKPVSESAEFEYDTDYSDSEYIEESEYSEYENEPYYSSTEIITTPDSTTYITNNYYYDDYNYDDYYDYSYAARIRRFHGPYHGFSYYDPYYTNMYWYNYNPYSWGTSIYLGYNWIWPEVYMGPSFFYGPTIYVGLGWGWGGYNWGWPYYRCGWPYYSWGYPYGSYWNGYWNGYWDGYYGWGPYYYYNSYDRYSNYYYGHRPSRGSTNSRTTVGRNARGLGEKYETALASERKAREPHDANIRGKANDRAAQSGSSRVAPASQRSERTAGNQSQEVRKIKPSESTKTAQSKAARQYTGKKEAPARVSKTGKISKPSTYTNAERTRNIGNESRQVKPQRKYSKPKTYNSPNYRKPKSSQEY
ncbi:MAG: hypothetical protein IMY69_06635, partial [Bacteroidetes bacterium]|nr:hypothetical protein [Bacteroidota bacterium]